MKNLQSNLKAVQTGDYKADVGAEAFWKSEKEPKLEQKEVVLAPRYWLAEKYCTTVLRPVGTYVVPVPAFLPSGLFPTPRSGTRPRRPLVSFRTVNGFWNIITKYRYSYEETE